MKVYEIISQKSNTLNELSVFGVPIPSGWLTNTINVIRQGGTKAMVARKALVEKLTDKYAAELVVARKEGRPDPLVYATLQKDLEKAGLSGKELKLVLDDVVAGAEKIYAKSSVVPGATNALGKGLFGKERTEAIKKAAAASKEAKYAASGMIAGLPKETIGLLQLAGVVGVVTAYYQRIKYCEAEYKKYPKGIYYQASFDGQPSTKEAAWQDYRTDSDQALGQLEVELAAILLPGVLLKIVKSLPTLLSFIPIIGGVVGGAARVAGGLMGILGQATAMLAKKSGMSAKQMELNGVIGLGAALTWIHTTEAGKNFMLNGMIGSVTQMIGTVSRKFFDQAADWAKQYDGPGAAVVNAAGDALGSTTAAGGGPQDPGKAAADAEQASNSKVPRFLRVITQGNVKYINNIKVTDNNGKLLPGLDSMIADTGVEAKKAGVPNPFDSIPKDPKVNYSPNIAL
jgi:hypothetical protein